MMSIPRIGRHKRLAGILGSALLLGCMASTPAHAANTLFDSFIYNGSRYSIFKSDMKLTWTDARDYAQTLPNSDLVSINDAAENAAIYPKITNQSLWADSNSPAGNYIGPYIGLHQAPPDADPIMNWKWVDGTSASYLNWNTPSGQPDNTPAEAVGVYYNGFYPSTNPLDPGIFTPGNTWGNVADISTTPYLATAFVVETPVPGPLPVVGALAAFRFSRRLRRTCRASAK
ncbi:MAG: C-type lectin domain-containing protein [Synechococcaceae cyanobacterium]